METPSQPLRALALVALVACAATLPVTTATQDDGPGKPAAYYGSVTDADGDRAPVGTEIVAVVNGSIVDRITVHELGRYGGEGATEDKLDASTNAGSTISFHLGSASGPVASPPGDHPLTEGTHDIDLVFPASAFEGTSDAGGGGTTTTPTTTTTTAASGSGSGGSGGSGGGGGGGGGGGTGAGGGNTAPTTTTSSNATTTATTPATTSVTTTDAATSTSDEPGGQTTNAGATSTGSNTTTAANTTSATDTTAGTTITDNVSRAPSPGFGPLVGIVGALAAVLLALRRD